MFRQLFPTLYFCPFFLMISKYRKIFLTTFIRTMFLSMIFILSCWSFHIPLHVWHIVFFCFFIQYLHIKSTSSFSFKQGTPQHVLHRSQGRNQKWTKRKEQWKDTVHPVIGITNQHMKKKTKNDLKHGTKCVHQKSELRFEKQIQSINRVPSDKSGQNGFSSIHTKKNLNQL